MPQQQYQQSRPPQPPVQDGGYNFRVVGENTDSDSDGEEYSNGAPWALAAFPKHSTNSYPSARAAPLCLM